MNEETEYTFLNNVDIENRVIGELYISTTLKLGKWNGKKLDCRSLKKEKEKFEIWKKENKDLCMEKPENPEIGDIWMHGGVEFRWCGRAAGNLKKHERTKGSTMLPGKKLPKEGNTRRLPIGNIGVRNLETRHRKRKSIPSLLKPLTATTVKFVN